MGATTSGREVAGTGVGVTATFITRKKAKVPKTVAEGWHQWRHRSPPGGSGGAASSEALGTSAPQVRLSKRVVMYSFMVSWEDGRTDRQPDHPLGGSGWPKGAPCAPPDSPGKP